MRYRYNITKFHTKANADNRHLEVYRIEDTLYNDSEFEFMVAGEAKAFPSIGNLMQIPHNIRNEFKMEEIEVTEKEYYRLKESVKK